MEMEGPTFAQGGNWSSSGGIENRYTYNGKEAIEEFNVGWLDYGARYYDAAIGRFTGVDPVAEKFPHVTTYNYAENEPVAGLDLWGLQRMDFNTYSDPGVQAYLKKKGRSKLTKEEDKLLNGPSRTAGGAILAVGSLFLPGPEDVVLGAAALKLIGGLFKSKKVSTKVDDLVSKADDLKKLKSLKKSEKSLQKNVNEHEQKLRDFLEDPVGNTSPEKMKEFTKDNPTKEELVNRIMNRVDELRSQIQKNQNELNKVKEQINKIEG